MSDESPLDERELRDLEARLAGVPLSPTAADRERINYACGYAAGRAQMKRRARAATALAVACATTSAVLGIMLWMPGGSKIQPEIDRSVPIANSQQQINAKREPAVVPRSNVEDGVWQLRAASRLDQLMSIEHRDVDEVAAIDDSSTTTILTPSGAGFVEDL